MSNEQDISITINNQTHHFKSNDIETMRKLPWSERKVLIELLENIKQAEYIKKETTSESLQAHALDAVINTSTDTIDAGIKRQPVRSPQPPVNKPSRLVANTTTRTDSVELDPAIKTSDKDVDDIMARLLLEQKSNQQHQAVPDKSTVVKMLLLVFVVIIVLALIF